MSAGGTRPGGLLSPAGTLYLVALLGATALALKPFAPADRVLDGLLLPTRVLPELAAPLAWSRSSSVRAAEVSLVAAEPATGRRIARWLEEGRRATLPTEPGLLAGRRSIHGVVVGRGEGRLDRIEVRLATLSGVELGMPVVTADWYLGRVVALHPERRSEVSVDLVTGADFFVGARLVAAGARMDGRSLARMVVGGLAPRMEGERATLALAVHNPSPRRVGDGDVLVDEPRPTDQGGFGDPWSWLANGFRLGTLEAASMGKGRRMLRVRPGLDYLSGLHQVIVLAPPGPLGGDERPALETFDPRRWLATRVLAPSSLSPGRAGLRLAAGRWRGIRRGAAVAFGAHLIGVVDHAGWATADVRLLGDAGLSLPALALIEGELAPRPLGELVALGRDGAGGLHFRWEARVPLGGKGDDALEAELLTGSGRVGVPPGLLLGRARLPRGGGVHELVILPDPRAARLSRLSVWRAASDEGESP